MNYKNTNILDYDINIKELNDTKVRVIAENYKHTLIRYYDVKGSFNQYISVITPKIKQAIIEMERGLDV